MPLFSEEFANQPPNSSSLHGVAHSLGDRDSNATHAKGIPRGQRHEGLTEKFEAMLLNVHKLRTPGQTQHFREALPVQRGRHRVTYALLFLRSGDGQPFAALASSAF